MRDLSFDEALHDPDLPFPQFVEACVELWNRASASYEEAGSPLGPAAEDDNVTRWLLQRIEAADHVHAAEQILGFDERSD